MLNIKTSSKNHVSPGGFLLKTDQPGPAIYSNIQSLGCSYLFCFLPIKSRIKHRAEVGEVEDGQETKNQVQQENPIFLQIKNTKRTYNCYCLTYPDNQVSGVTSTCALQSFAVVFSVLILKAHCLI